MSNFKGKVYPKVFDKNRTVETLSNDDGTAFTFQARNNILYSGEATVTDGEFSFGFYIPKTGITFGFSFRNNEYNRFTLF